MRINTQSVLALSATPAAMGSEAVCIWAAPAASGIGAGIRSHVEPMGTVATVRSGSLQGERARENSVQLGVKRMRTILLNSLQLSGYGFGAPVDVNVQDVDVPTGVPPRSRPV